MARFNCAASSCTRLLSTRNCDTIPTSSWCCAVTVPRSRAIAASSRPASASANAPSIEAQKPADDREQALLLRHRPLGRREVALGGDRLRQIQLAALEGLPPRDDRVRLGAFRHVADRQRQLRQVVLDAQQLQRIEPVALADAGLLVAQLPDLGDGVEAEREDGAEGDREADQQAQRRVAPPPGGRSRARVGGGRRRVRHRASRGGGR